MLPRAKYICIKDAIIVEKCMYQLQRREKENSTITKNSEKNAGQNPSRYQITHRAICMWIAENFECLWILKGVVCL